MPLLTLRRSLAVTAAALAAVGPLAAPASATPWPSKPAHVKVAGITSTTLTVSASKAKNAKKYRVWASPTISDLYRSALSKHRSARHLATSSKPLVTVRGLHYRSGPLYYRFATVNGSHLQLTPTRTTYLRPPVPSSVAVGDPLGRPYLTWSVGDATGYQVRQTDEADPTAVTTYTLQGRAQAFTPPSMTLGHTYDLQVRALNGTVGSAYSAVVSATPSVDLTAPLTVVTHNELSPSSTSYPSMAPWDDRKDAMVKLYQGAGADLLLVQEGGQLVRSGVRQVDTIANSMGADWTVARTETPPGGGGWKSHGVYIVFDDARFDALGSGSTLDLPSGVPSRPKYAAFQVLRDARTKGEFVAVSAHLIAGTTAAVQKLRTQEMQDVLVEDFNYVSKDQIRR